MEPIVEGMERWPGYLEQSWQQRFFELDRRLHITQDRLMAAMIGRLSTPSPDLKADNAALEQWRHKTRGTVYEKIGVAELQCAAGLNPGEGDGLVVYRGEDGKLWARLADEFHDGRFEAVAGLTTDS